MKHPAIVPFFVVVLALTACFDADPFPPNFARIEQPHEMQDSLARMIVAGEDIATAKRKLSAIGFMCPAPVASPRSDTMSIGEQSITQCMIRVPKPAERVWHVTIYDSASRIVRFRTARATELSPMMK
jgi:hypothetical protein